MNTPDYIFETSWEVCNRVGGIYAVLSTRAASMQKEHPDKVFFFGPDFGKHSDLYFKEDKALLRPWRSKLDERIPVRVGRWMVPGEPIAILLKADNLWSEKDQIYAWAWENFCVRSHAAYGDYDESCLFGYAAGQVMESLYHYLTGVGSSTAKRTKSKQQAEPAVVMHANEWQTAFAVFYLRYHCPKIGTLFTTHATGIGRSIAGNGKPLYDYFEGYHGDQMAEELNMVSKHSVEKMAAHWADCFTTVSDITAKECAQLLDKAVDIVTPNGFEPGFVPEGKAFDRARASARAALISTAEKLLSTRLADNSLLVGIAGRLEWKNKGIDVFLCAMERLGDKLYHVPTAASSLYPVGEVIAFVMVPYLDKPVMRFGKVTVVFIPHYLNGNSMPENLSQLAPISGKSYYDLLVGLDVTVFPSYYEPWGYTPLESIAFHVPTVTTDVAGFGAWAQQEGVTGLQDGVAVVHRSDSNFDDVVDNVALNLFRFMQQPAENIDKARKAAAALAKKAEWRNFFKYYRKAYDIALSKSLNR